MAGETTSASSTKAGRKLAGSGLCAQTFTLTYATGQLELNDVYEAGYLPAGVTVVGAIYAPHDMDSSTGVVQKITIGSTDVATGLTGGVLGAVATAVPGFRAFAPYSTTDKTLVKVTTTTAPSGTAAAGTTYVTLVYYTT